MKERGTTYRSTRAFRTLDSSACWLLNVWSAPIGMRARSALLSITSASVPRSTETGIRVEGGEEEQTPFSSGNFNEHFTFIREVFPPVKLSHSFFGRDSKRSTGGPKDSRGLCSLCAREHRRMLMNTYMLYMSNYSIRRNENREEEWGETILVDTKIFVPG